jgi:hypothetical protein
MRLGTMLADRGVDSRKKDSMMTVAPTPTVAAAAGTVIYQNLYGDTEAPAEAQKKRGKRLKTTLANQGKDTRKTDSMMTAAPTPSVAAFAGTMIYQNQYGVTDVPAVALASDEEVDYMTDGSIVISRPSKEPVATKNPSNTVAIADYRNDDIAVSGGKAPGKDQSGNDKAVPSNQSGNDDAVTSSDYFVASADYETRGSGRSGRTRKPPVNKL